MEILPSGDKACIKNQCKCGNGVAVENKDCFEHGQQKCHHCFRDHFLKDSDDHLRSCIRCPDNHHSNGTLHQCFENECTCRNGVAVNNNECSVHQKNICQKCDESYNFHAEEKICSSENKCYCDNGNAVVNNECNEHNSNQCESCNDGYYPNEKTSSCMINQCQCPHGQPVDDKFCPKNGQIRCKQDECNKFHYYSPDDHTCKKNVCKCINGQPNEDCEADGANRCMGCNSGFHLDGNDCIKDSLD